MNLEQEYKAIDFSRFSMVKETLRAKLHEERKQAARFTGVKHELSFDELDYAVAAGNPNAMRAPSSDGEVKDSDK